MKKRIIAGMLSAVFLSSLIGSAFAQDNQNMVDIVDVNESVSSEFYDETTQEQYIELIQYMEENALTANVSYETFLETYSQEEYEDYASYLSIFSEEDTAVSVGGNELPVSSEEQPINGAVPSEGEFTEAYEVLVSVIEMNTDQVSLSYETFVSEYFAGNYASLEDYVNGYYDILGLSDGTDAEQIQSANTIDAEWWYNTGLTLPRRATYSSYNLLGTVKPGDIVFEANGFHGITGHIAIVEGTYYSSTYNQFYVRIIEAIEDGVCRSVLDDTRVDNMAITMLRVKKTDGTLATQTQANGAVNFCISQLGKPYGLDFAHDTSSSSANWYCSELVYAAYYHQGILINEPSSFSEPGITPREMLNSPNIYAVSFAQKSSVQLTDISSHWAYSRICFVVDNGIMPSLTTTKFYPESTATRSVVVSSIYKLAGSPTAVYSEPFTDVTSSSSYYHAVAWGYNTGIVSGTTTTTFSPNSNVTREQFASFLYRFARYQGYDTSYNNSCLSGYSDASSISSYAVTPMKWAITHNIVSGRTTTTLEPTGTCKRAEMATMLQCFVNYIM